MAKNGKTPIAWQEAMDHCARSSLSFPRPLPSPSSFRRRCRWCHRRRHPPPPSSSSSLSSWCCAPLLSADQSNGGNVAADGDSDANPTPPAAGLPSNLVIEQWLSPVWNWANLSAITGDSYASTTDPWPVGHKGFRALVTDGWYLDSAAGGECFLLAPPLPFILKTLVFIEKVCRRMALLLRRRL